MIVDYAEWFLFAWVLSNQSGVPVPVVPALLGAGALAGNGRLNLAVVIAIAVGASLAADLTWYGLVLWFAITMTYRLRVVKRPSASAPSRRAWPRAQRDPVG